MEGSRDSHVDSMSKRRGLCVCVCVRAHKCMAVCAHGHTCMHAHTHTQTIENSDKETVSYGVGVMKRWGRRKMQIGLS